MCSQRNLAPTVVLCLLLVACSSSGKGGSTDAGAYDGGLTIDTNLTVLDSAKAADVRDAASATEAAARHDVPVAIDTSDAPKSIDTTGDTKDGPRALDGGSSNDGGFRLDSQNAVDTSKPSDGKDAAKASDTIDAPRIADASDARTLIDTAALDVGGAIDAPPPNGCENPIEIPMDMPHVDLTLSTDGENHDFKLPCATGGNDIVLSFYLDRSEMVYADTFGSGWDTLLAFSPTCPLTSPVAYPGTVACNNDACGTKQSQVVAIMPNGRHYLVLSGNNDESGSVTLHFQHTPVAAGPSTNLPAGSGTITGTTSGPSRLTNCEANGPENGYWWVSCSDYAGGAFSASTCTGTDPNLDVVLALQIPRDGTLVCANGDSCGLQESMTTTVPAGAGINYLTVDGDQAASAGNYTLVYTRP